MHSLHNNKRGKNTTERRSEKSGGPSKKVGKKGGRTRKKMRQGEATGGVGGKGVEGKPLTDKQKISR